MTFKAVLSYEKALTETGDKGILLESETEAAPDHHFTAR